MVFQNDEGLNKNIRASGCYFLSLLYIAQIENNYEYTVGSINSFYKYCVRQGYIDKTCTIIKPDNILNHLLKDDKKIYQIGVIQDGESTYWGWVRNYHYEWVILQHETNSSYGTHFTVVNPLQIEQYDSMKGKGYTSNKITRSVLYQLQ